MSNIIRQDHAGVHNIQPFTMLEVTIDLATLAPGRVVPGRVITGADAYAVPVRLFDFYGHPANVDASARGKMESESDTMGVPTAVAAPETTKPPPEPTALDEAAALQEEASARGTAALHARQGA